MPEYSRKLTKKERAQAEKAAAPLTEAARMKKVATDRRNRRLLIIGGITFALGGVAAVSLFPTRQTAPTQVNSGETDFAKFLEDLDKRATGRNGSDVVFDNAPEITERSFHQVGKYLGEKPTEVTGNVKFYRDSQKLREGLINDGACPNIGPNIVASTRSLNNRPSWIGISTQPLNPKPATDISDSAIHEDIHFRTNTRDFKPEDMTPFLPRNAAYHTIDGLKAISVKSGSTPGDLCRNNHHRYQLFEGFVEFSTMQIMLYSGIKLGNNGYNSHAYPAWTAAYAENIGRLFLMDHKSQLLLPALRSEANIFFRNLGSRIDPFHNNPALIGEQRTVEVFSKL